MVKPGGQADDGLKPRRVHRRRQPWRGAELGPKELAVDARMYPLRVLLHVLSQDVAFRRDLEAVRSRVDAKARRKAAEGAARRYARRRGRPRLVLEEILTRAAGASTGNAQVDIMGIGAQAVWTTAEPSSEDPQRWRHAHYREAAAMVARLGARQCLVCGSRLASDGRRRYCSAHAADEPLRGRADRELMQAVLNAAGHALGVPACRT